MLSSKSFKINNTYCKIALDMTTMSYIIYTIKDYQELASGSASSMSFLQRKAKKAMIKLGANIIIGSRSTLKD
jgi:hypothetical protein